MTKPTPAMILEVAKILSVADPYDGSSDGPDVWVESIMKRAVIIADSVFSPGTNDTRSGVQKARQQSMIEDANPDTPTSELGLTSRAVKALERAGWMTLGQVVERPRKEVADTNSVSKGSMERLDDLARNAGLTWGVSTSEAPESSDEEDLL